MEKRLNNENYAVYKMIATVEELDGKRVLMYGIEGRNKDERISVSSLTDDKERKRRRGEYSRCNREFPC